MMKPAPFLILAISASPAFAADTVALPQGCTAYLTAQLASCMVSHYFTCENDPAGHQHRIDFDEEGAVYVGTTDAEGQWLKSFRPVSGEQELLLPDSVDPASLSELFDTGIDTFDFATDTSGWGETRYRGFDRMTGVTLQMGQFLLEETEYTLHANFVDGELLWSASGHEYVLRDHRAFVAGLSTYQTPDGDFESDDRPKEMIAPDEPGFLSIHPKYGCGETLSALPQTLIPAAVETNDDQI